VCEETRKHGSGVERRARARRLGNSGGRGHASNDFRKNDESTLSRRSLQGPVRRVLREIKHFFNTSFVEKGNSLMHIFLQTYFLKN